LFVVASLRGSGQQNNAISIGMSSEQVNSILGMPMMYYDAGLRSFTQSFPVVAKGPIWECHRRLTKLQEYEVRVRYRVDDSASRLHPTLRVAGIWIIFDKALKFKETLLDSAEIRTLCRRACTLQIVQHIQRHGASPRPAYIRIADQEKTEEIALGYSSQNGEPKSVIGPEDLISEINIEAFYSLEKYASILEVADAGMISSAQWAPE
jgi:hypothetical protein